MNIHSAIVHPGINILRPFFKKKQSLATWRNGEIVWTLFSSLIHSFIHLNRRLGSRGVIESIPAVRGRNTPWPVDSPSQESLTHSLKPISRLKGSKVDSNPGPSRWDAAVRTVCLLLIFRDATFFTSSFVVFWAGFSETHVKKQILQNSHFKIKCFYYAHPHAVVLVHPL